MALDQPPIDTSIDIVTPENIAFSYRVAGPFRRLLAYAIDSGIRATMVLVVLITGWTFLVHVLGEMWIAIAIISWFLLSWFYGGLFETFMNGQTPGKRMLGLRVLTSEGQPINGMQAVMRNILRTVDIMPMMSGGIGMIVMASNSRFQRLGDIVCNTMVVSEERRWLTGVVPIEDKATLELAAKIPPEFEARRTLARALAAYVERRSSFSRARRLEIASRLAVPLCKRLRFPLDTDYDRFLCALYYRLFIGKVASGQTDAASNAAPSSISPTVSSASASSASAPVAAPLGSSDTTPPPPSPMEDAR